MISLAAFLFFALRQVEILWSAPLKNSLLGFSTPPKTRLAISALCLEGSLEALCRIPLAGEGFGVPFIFDRLFLENDPRPHNTFFTVLYKMGLAGFLPSSPY